MAEQDGKRAFENEEKHSIDVKSNVSEEKEQKFKKATVKLKTEALRRYKLQEKKEGNQNKAEESTHPIQSDIESDASGIQQETQNLESKSQVLGDSIEDFESSLDQNSLESRKESKHTSDEAAQLVNTNDTTVKTSVGEEKENNLNTESSEKGVDQKAFEEIEQKAYKNLSKETLEEDIYDKEKEKIISKEELEILQPQHSPVSIKNHSLSENQKPSEIEREDFVDVSKSESTLSKGFATSHSVLEENTSLGNDTKEERTSLNNQNTEIVNAQVDTLSSSSTSENKINTEEVEKEALALVENQTITEDYPTQLETSDTNNKEEFSATKISEEKMSGSVDKKPLETENTEKENDTVQDTTESVNSNPAPQDLVSEETATSKETTPKGKSEQQISGESRGDIDNKINEALPGLEAVTGSSTADMKELNSDAVKENETQQVTENSSQEQTTENTTGKVVEHKSNVEDKVDMDETHSGTVDLNQESIKNEEQNSNVDGKTDESKFGEKILESETAENLGNKEEEGEQTTSEQNGSADSTVESDKPQEVSIDQNNELSTEQGVSISQTSIVSKKSSTQIGEYELDDHVSKATTTPDMPQHFLTLFHSFGYECTKRWNLHMLTPEHIIFSAGNTFQIMNLKTSEQINMRSTSGGGVGAIAVHPSLRYFAVSEKGVNPNIIIYQYPSLKLHRILRGGTEAAYSNLDFSPSGEKLASVGSYPDFMMTVWDWNKEQIILRSKAFSQDVYKVAFSPEDEGHLCSSGTGHIKFWTMANTFTGLKLQGDLGRFGTTELSDISGFVELPDGKVLSGSEWGNMLLWDGGLIKAELTRKKKKTCHQGNIEQFFLDEGELITIGADGYVKVWDFESIDNADSLNESKLFEIEPMSELKVGADVKLLSMIKSIDEEESNNWFAQDSNGGIWSLDLSFSHTSQAPMKMFSYHSGKVLSLSMSPVSHVAATTGEDGTVRLYDYFAKKSLCQKKFNTSGHSVLWIPKVIDTACSSILVGFADGVIRHLTITNSNKRNSKNPNASNVTLHLSQVFKPHLKAVTCMVIDTPGKILATGSEDGIVFFFQIDKTFKPIGFVEVSTHVVSLEWSSVSKGGKLLVVGKDGAVFEFKAPQAGKLDTSKSFQLPLEDLLINKFQFESVKDDLLRKEEEERKAKEAKEKQRKKQAEVDRKRALGITEEDEGANEEGKDEEKKKEGEDEDENDEEKGGDGDGIHQKGNVLRGFYKCASSDNFMLTLDSWDAGFFYECKFPVEKKKVDEKQAKLMKKFGQEPDKEKDEENIKAIKIPEINDVPISSISFSKNGDFMAMGLQNGAVRVQNMKRTTLEKLDSYWFINAHDNQTGVIRDIAISFDNKFLMSVGEDGNIFTFSFMDQERLKQFEKTRTQMKAKTIDSRPADDIDDPKHYSIELEKQKAEQDKKLRLAEEKKQNVKTVIGKLRREFRKLKGKNAELPSYLQLPTADFIIDPQMKTDIEEETKKKVDLLKKETAWESKKHEVALRKLHQRYIALMECDRIVLYSFLTDHNVASFRSNELSEEFVVQEDENQEKMNFAGAGAFLTVMTKTFKRRERGQSTYRKNSTGKRKASSLGEEQEKEEAQSQKQQQQSNQPPQKLEGKVAKMIEKAEQRKQKRIARQKEWEELYRNQPDENYEDPEDCEAIELARKTIGDFKLKTASDFVVPEKERVNAEKKRSELFSLIREMHDMKKKFNDKLLMLRNRKIESIAEIKELVEKLELVQSHLPKRCHVALPTVPEMKPEEEPEKKIEYTKEMLIEFRKNVLGLEITHTDDNTTNAGPAIETHTSKAATRATNDPRLRSPSIISTYSSLPPSGSSVMYETPDVGEGERREHLDLEENEEEKSELQMMIEKEQEIRLTYERNELLREVREKLILFDAVLRLLRHEKVNLDTTLKNAELRKVTLFEECMLLKEFEKRENGLAEKVYTKMQERDELEDKVDELRDTLDEQKEELETLQERESSLTVTLNNTIGDGNKFEAFLIKMYKKKIKRVKKKVNNEGSSEENSDDDDDSDDYDGSDGSDVDSDEDELDDTVCPPGCDPAIYDQISTLRERRLDLEDGLLEAKKLYDGMKKDLDTLTKKVKVVDNALKNARSDLEAFQREKQQKLNELDVVVTLKLDQIQYVLNNALPQDLSQCLIIRGSFLNRLQRRIKELEREKITQKQLYKERRQQHVQMLRDKKTMQKKIKELEERVQQIQMLKFGRLVDLEKLETVSVNRVAEELKEKLRIQEEHNIKDLNNWDKMIDKLQTELTLHVKENTKRLDTYTVLHRAYRELEVSLDARQKNLGSEFQGNRKADEIERTRLAQLVQMQSSEIQQLEDEINMLSRKGGHVLPPHRNTQISRENNNNNNNSFR